MLFFFKNYRVPFSLKILNACKIWVLIYSSFFFFGCSETPEIPEVHLDRFSLSQFSSSGMPFGWELRGYNEKHFQESLPLLEEEEINKGKELMLRSLRIDALSLSTLARVVLVGTDAQGLFQGIQVKLEPLLENHQDEEQKYLFTLERLRFGHYQKTEFTLDRQFRLLHYKSQREQTFLAARSTELIRAWWQPSSEPDSSGQYIIKKDLGKEHSLDAQEKMIPDELIPFLALLLPAENLRAQIPVISVHHKQGYHASLQVRLRHSFSHDEVGQEQLDALVFVSSSSPTSGRYIFGLSYHPIPKVQYLTLNSATRLYPEASGNFDRITLLLKLLQEEKSRFIFDGEKVFSRFSPEGKILNYSENPHAFEKSWFALQVAPLKLGVGVLPELYPAHLLGMVGEENLESDRAGLSESSQGTKKNADPFSGLRQEISPGQRGLDILLDLLPSGLSLEDYAKAAVSNLIQQDLTVSGYEQKLFSNGQRIRIDISQPQSFKPQEGESGSAQNVAYTIYHSFYFVQQAGVVVRLQYSCAGEKALMFWDKRQQVFDSLRVQSNPFMKSP